jgi:hypothetical protein
VVWLPQPAWARSARGSKLLSELCDDPVLQLEDLFERAIRLRFRDRFAACGIHDARRDAQPIARTLEASDDGEVQIQVRAERRQVAPGTAHRFDDPHTIDDAHGAGGAQIVGHGLGDPR